MAIAVDTTSTLDESYTGTTSTLSHTCTGSDLVLLVGTNNDSVAGAVTGITYNGVALTKQAENTITGGGGQTNGLWYLDNPATGTNDIVVTFTNTGGFTSIRAISYTGSGGVDTTAGTYNNDNQNQTVTSLATSVTTAQDNSWTALVARADQAISAGTGTTMRHAGAYRFADSGSAVTPAGSNTLTTTTAGSTAYFSHIMVTLKPVASTFRPHMISF